MKPNHFLCPKSKKLAKSVCNIFSQKNALRIFLKLGMKLGHNRGSNMTWPFFYKNCWFWYRNMRRMCETALINCRLSKFTFVYNNWKVFYRLLTHIRLNCCFLVCKVSYPRFFYFFKKKGIDECPEARRFFLEYS